MSGAPLGSVGVPFGAISSGNLSLSFCHSASSVATSVDSAGTSSLLTTQTRASACQSALTSMFCTIEKPIEGSHRRGDRHARRTGLSPRRRASAGALLYRSSSTPTARTRTTIPAVEGNVFLHAFSRCVARLSRRSPVQNDCPIGVSAFRTLWTRALGAFTCESVEDWVSTLAFHLHPPALRHWFSV